MPGSEQTSEIVKTKKKTAKEIKSEVEKLLPSHIYVLGKKVEIVVTTGVKAEGDFDPYRHKIRINPAQGVEKAKETLFHESVHAVWAYSGLNQLMSEDLEEAVTRALDYGISRAVDVTKLENMED
jgi:hypothetical protein